MPVADGLQTRFFEASLGDAAAGCCAPMVVSLQFVRDCAAARIQSLSQEDANPGDFIGAAPRLVQSFPVHELCLSRQPDMLQHITANTVSALEAAGQEQVVATFISDWFKRAAQDRFLDDSLWLVRLHVASACCALLRLNICTGRSSRVRRGFQVFNSG
jgi:hypothetical protein